MKVRRLCAVLGALAACAGGPPPAPHEQKLIIPPFPAPGTPKALDEEPAKPWCERRMNEPRPVDLQNRWFVFIGAPYGGSRHWVIETPGLPAISKDGKRVLVEDPENFGPDSPTLTLRVLRASDGAVLETRKLLPYAEMAAGQDEKLRVTWTERLRAFAAKLDAEGWEPLEKCWLGDHDPHTECGATQEVRCGPAVAITYTEPRLSVAVRGTGAVTKSNAAWRAANHCSWLGQVAFNPARRLVVARISRFAPMCHYCDVPLVFTTAHLPAAPPRVPPPIVGQCPAGMSMVPAGHVYGAANEPRCASLAPHDPAVGPLCVDDTPVTVDAYRHCVTDQGCFTPVRACALDSQQRGTDPVICNRTEEHAAYCAWAGKRSLTSDEVEYLARLGRPGGADERGFRCALGLSPSTPR